MSLQLAPLRLPKKTRQREVNRAMDKAGELVCLPFSSPLSIFHNCKFYHPSIILEAIKIIQGLTPFASHYMNFPVHLVHEPTRMLTMSRPLESSLRELPKTKWIGASMMEWVIGKCIPCVLLVLTHVNESGTSAVLWHIIIIPFITHLIHLQSYCWHALPHQSLHLHQ
jgi:hypothetical protein